jgi:hypothetical protein
MLHDDGALMAAMAQEKMKDPDKSITGLSALFASIASKIGTSIALHRADKIINREKKRQRLKR